MLFVSRSCHSFHLLVRAGRPVDSRDQRQSADDSEQTLSREMQAVIDISLNLRLTVGEVSMREGPSYVL